MWTYVLRHRRKLRTVYRDSQPIGPGIEEPGDQGSCPEQEGIRVLGPVPRPAWWERGAPVPSTN